MPDSSKDSGFTGWPPPLPPLLRLSRSLPMAISPPYPDTNPIPVLWFPRHSLRPPLRRTDPLQRGSPTRADPGWHGDPQPIFRIIPFGVPNETIENFRALSDLRFAFQKKAKRILVNSALFFGHDAPPEASARQAASFGCPPPLTSSGRSFGIGYLAPLGSHHASIFQGFTLAIVSFETPHGITPHPQLLISWSGCSIYQENWIPAVTNQSTSNWGPSRFW